MKLINLLETKITNISPNKIGVVEPKYASTKDYKKHPGDFTSACNAAMYYALKFKQDMVIIPGNSYMNKVYHIAKVSDKTQIHKIVTTYPTKCAIINLEGEVRMAEIDK